MLYGLQMDIVTDHLNKNDKKNICKIEYANCKSIIGLLVMMCWHCLTDMQMLPIYCALLFCTKLQICIMYADYAIIAYYAYYTMLSCAQ